MYHNVMSEVDGIYSLPFTEILTTVAELEGDFGTIVVDNLHFKVIAFLLVNYKIQQC